MYKINILLFLVVVFSSRINAQFDSILGLPLEYNEQKTIDEWEQDISNDIWDEVEAQHQDDSPEKLLQKLCAQYDLQFENKLLICDDINILSNNHEIRKRQTDDEDDGSGDDSPIEAEEEEKAHILLEAKEEAPRPLEAIPIEDNTTEKSIEHEVSTPEANIAGESIEHEASTPEANIAGESIKQEVTNAETSTLKESTEEKIIKESPFKKQGLLLSLEEPSKEDHEEQSTEAPSTESDTKQEVHESTTEQIKQVPTETTTEEKTLDIGEPIKTDIEEKSPETPSGEISTTQEVIESTTEQTKEVPTEIKTEEETKIVTDVTTAPADKNEHSTEPKSFKKQALDIPKEVPAAEGVKSDDDASDVPKVEMPIKDSETESKTTELSNSNKEVDQLLGHGVEEIIPNQSGNAVLNENKGSISDTEKKIRKMSANESIKSEVTETEEEPKSGASESDGGKKDTKLLIIICGLVAAVGVAAFAYSFIKKRKPTPVQATRPVAMNGNADVEDAEAGREMKPLMKSPQSSNTVEYTDEK